MFRATGAEIIGQEVRIAFPAVIERLQRRTAYRLDAPLGTKMRLTLDGREFEMTVINISEGGALVTMQKAMEMTPVFQGGERVKHVLVRFPSDHPSLRVSIREAVVKRVEKDAESARVRYALSFTEIRMPEKQALSKIIYGLQREYLRKRQFMEA
jgi:c-di-GMP-binding flagellar brake protein YcgR